jgi:hypothetical protein
MCYIRHLDMFRALPCSSSGGQNCISTASGIVTLKINSKTEILPVVIRYCLNDSICERFLLFNPGGKLASNSFYYIKITLKNIGRDSHNCISQTYYGVVLADKRDPSNYLCTLHKPPLGSSSFSCPKIHKIGNKLLYTFEQTVCVLNRLSMANFLHKNIGNTIHS